MSGPPLFEFPHAEIAKSTSSFLPSIRFRRLRPSIFGIGMCLAGGCASGSLYKIGEGNGTSIAAVIFGLCIGQAVFVDVGGPFLKLLPQAWIDKAEQTQAAILQYKGIEIPLNSWFDTYLVGYVWTKPQMTVAKIYLSTIQKLRAGMTINH